MIELTTNIIFRHYVEVEKTSISGCPHTHSFYTDVLFDISAGEKLGMIVTSRVVESNPEQIRSKSHVPSTLHLYERGVRRHFQDLAPIDKLSFNRGAKSITYPRSGKKLVGKF